MCGGFTCSKNSLFALNIFYILVGFILIGVGTYSRTVGYVSSIPVVGGIVACGVFLLMIAVLGLIGTAKHHQVLLFFYMVVLFLLFIIQFSIACACLAFSSDQQQFLAAQAWNNSGDAEIDTFQGTFKCCGFAPDEPEHNIYYKKFNTSECPGGKPDNSSGLYSDNCWSKTHDMISYAFRASGGVGLFFSFTELAGFITVYRYRNMISPISQLE